MLIWIVFDNCCNCNYVVAVYANKKAAEQLAATDKRYYIERWEVHSTFANDEED